MTLFRYKRNGLLYTITRDCGRMGSACRAHPYQHNTEIGMKSKRRFREFKSNMVLADFEEVAVQ